MSGFSSQQTVEDGKVVLSFAGPIDENTNFPQPDFGDASAMVLDLNDVTYINSVGIKGWIQWIMPIAEAHAIEFRRCPKAIIFQINMVKNFLPPKAKVTSFYLPLFCEACDKEQAALVEVDKDLQVGAEGVKVSSKLASLVSCGEGDACEVELDVIEKKYFRFLQEG